MRLSRPMQLLLLALGAMFVQQTFASIGRNMASVIAPAILLDLELDDAWVGVYVGIGAMAALAAQLGCGSFILRHGALRMSQVALTFLAAGLALAACGWISLLALSAIIGGGGSAISTPTSSHLLGRYSPPRYAPLVFSLKQTAVPAGLLIVGLMGPALTAYGGWRFSMGVAAVACLAFAFALQPLRREFDSDRDPSRHFHASDFLTTLTSVLRTAELRNLSLACFAFNGLQTVFTAYFIVYLTELDYSLAEAGAVFSVAMAVAVPGRILWGWLGSTLVTPRAMMGALAAGMAVSALAMGLFGPGWPVWAVGLVGCCLSVTAMSWHGVLLAETARLAPAGNRGAATGGVLSFGQTGALLQPLFYALVLSLGGGHGLGFALCGLPAVVVAVALLANQPPREREG